MDLLLSFRTPNSKKDKNVFSLMKRMHFRRSIVNKLQYQFPNTLSAGTISQVSFAGILNCFNAFAVHSGVSRLLGDCNCRVQAYVRWQDAISVLSILYVLIKKSIGSRSHFGSEYMPSSPYLQLQVFLGEALHCVIVYCLRTTRIFVTVGRRN